MLNIIYAIIVIIGTICYCLNHLKQSKKTNYMSIDSPSINSIIGFSIFVAIMVSLQCISHLFILKITYITICITFVPTVLFTSYKHFVNTRNLLDLVSWLIVSTLIIYRFYYKTIHFH